MQMIMKTIIILHQKHRKNIMAMNPYELDILY